MLRDHAQRRVRPGDHYRALSGMLAIERGFTLIEMMVAMTLMLLVLGVLAALFGGTSGSRSEVERSGRLAEDAAYALDLLTDEVRLAGYFAETNLTGVAWQVPDPCATVLVSQGWQVAPFNAPVAIMGYRPADLEPACITNRKAGTAILVLRHVSVDTTPIAAANGKPFLQVSKCNTDPAQFVYADATGNFTLRKLDCATTADVRQAVVRSYYVSTCNDCGKDTIPTLKRAELVGNAIEIQPLVEGIENLQVMYGFDIDGDGNADEYLPGLSGVAGAPDNDWSNVVSARVYVLGRSTDISPGYKDQSKQFYMGLGSVLDYTDNSNYTAVANDAYKRVQLSALARLNNMAGRRETP